MARKQFKRGYVYLDGDKWKGRYREDVIDRPRPIRFRGRNWKVRRPVASTAILQ